jgi:hypothetical protein
LARYSLENVRADGWLEKLGEGSPSFGQLCQVMDERFVGFSIIAGLRIAALSFDARSPERSTVEIDLGEGGKRARLPMGELQEKLASAMVDGPTPPAPPLPESPSTDELQAAIGYRWVLLSPLFHLRLETLRVERDLTTIGFTYDGELQELPLEAFRERLRDGVRGALERLAAQRKSPTVGSPFAIDLGLVARAAAHGDAGEHQKIVELLGNWPGPLSVLLRTAEGQSLAAEARTQIATALGLLGSAHVHLGRFDWGVEVLRLGIQWAQDGDASRELFLRLGHAYLEAEREGEAIGLLRRARELGAPDAQVAPGLARAFAARGRHLASLVWVHRARRSGGSGSELERYERAARSALGEGVSGLEKALKGRA